MRPRMCARSGRVAGRGWHALPLVLPDGAIDVAHAGAGPPLGAQRARGGGRGPRRGPGCHDHRRRAGARLPGPAPHDAHRDRHLADPRRQLQRLTRFDGRRAGPAGGPARAPCRGAGRDAGAGRRTPMPPTAWWASERPRVPTCCSSWGRAPRRSPMGPSRRAWTRARWIVGGGPGGRPGVACVGGRCRRTPSWSRPRAVLH